MLQKLHKCLAMAVILLLLGATASYAASYEWTQTDWGGGTSSLSAQHPDNQTGWDKFLQKDTGVDTSTPGQISVPPVSSTMADTEFVGGVSDNTTVVGTGQDAYLKLTDYPLSFGTGRDLNLTIDGKTPANSSDGLAHPRPLSPPAGLTFSTGGAGSLRLGTTYFYRVVAFNSRGESIPVKGSYSLPVNSRGIVLSWNSVPCAEGYRIYGRGSLSQERTYGLLATVPSSQTSWEDSGALSPGISTSTTTTGGTTLLNGYYHYKITAYNENGETTFALVEALLPTNGGTITITWTPVPWATGYNIYGRPRQYNEVYGFLTTTTTSTWTDTGIYAPDITRAPEENNVSDGSYFIDTLREYENVNIVNCGSVSAPAGTILSSPANLRADIFPGIDGPNGTFNYVVTAIDLYGFESRRSNSAAISVSGANAVQVSWDAVTGAVGYRVYRSTTTSFSTTSLVCNTTATSCIDNVGTPSYGGPHITTSSLPTPSVIIYTTGGNMSQGTYYYVLTAIDTSGFETTPGPQRVATVSTSSGTASVALSWSAVPDASGYRVYRTNTSGLYNSPSLICKIDNPAVRLCTDTLLNPTEGTPSRSYDHALAYGKLDFRVRGTLYVDSSSMLHLNGKGYPGGNSVTLNSAGLAGSGPGAGGDRGAGAGYATVGTNNSSGTGNFGYTYGDSMVTTPYLGSGGASGSVGSYQGISGRGGGGGGAIKVFASTMTIDGAVLTNGNDGRDGYGTDLGYIDGGGGGSGGSLLLGGRTVSLSAVSALGGTGGGPASSRYFRYDSGGSGGDGRIHLISDNIVSGNISPAPYTGNRGTFESRSFQLDTGGVTFSTIRWTASVPANSALKFQIATNKDNATWNFVGPDGASGSYYTLSGTAIHPSHNGDRFFKYKVYMDSLTTNPLDSPVVSDLSIDYLYTPRYQTLVSSPFNTNATANSITRMRWSEGISAGADVVLQLRTSADGAAWGAWLGPHNTTFSASAGVRTITVANTIGFTVGSRITLTNSANPSQGEVKKITTISANSVTLDSNTTYNYSSNSIFTDTYTETSGSEPVNSIHKDGVGDRWLQYKVYLFSDSSTDIPYLFESIFSYGGISAVYKPDGIIDSNGDNIYGAAGSGAGGASSPKSTNPAVQVGYNLTVQNDGNVDSIDDVYEITWTSPSDVSGIWSVVLNDGVQDFTSAMMPVRTERIPVNGSKNYAVKVTPSPNAPPGNKDAIIDIHSGSDYSKVDSVKATVTVNIFYKTDGIIDGNGDNTYDTNRTGGGGTSTRQADPGNTLSYDIILQNEGNVSDTYTLSLSNTPLTGWKVFINDGSKDYDIADPSKGFTTPSMPSPPDAGSTKLYTLKVIPIGSPTTQNVILNIYSNGGVKYVDSLTATVVVNPVIGVDGIMNGHGDNIRGAAGSGDGGFTSKDILAGTTDSVVVGIQNEGNVADSFVISWNTPLGWSVVLADTLLDGSPLTCTSPCEVPKVFLGTWPKYSSPDKYNPGEVPPFTFKITTPLSFTSGSQTIVFDIQSAGDSTKVDSVKAIINSGDTTPPAAAVLSTGSITAVSVRVSWTAPGDDGTSGTAVSYDLRYSTSPITDANFALASKVSSCKIGESDLRRPRAAGGAESCTVSRLFANTDHYFALKTTDDAGNTSAVSTCSGCPARTLTSSDITRPGAITDLVVTDAAKDTVTVCWTAPADDGTTSSSGPATGYELRYSTRYIVDDGISPGAGQVAFSSATLAQDISLPKSPGEKECYVISVKNEINTGGGIKDDRTRNARFYFAIKALDEARNKSLLSNIASGLTPLVSYAYNMVSVPYVPSPNTPADVLGDDVGTPLYVYHWDSRGPNIANGCYDGVPGPYSNTGEVCNVLSSIKEGLGYFLWVPAKNVILDVPSGSTESPANSCVYDVVNNLLFTCYELPLQDGWNMIGIPFDREINLSNRDVNGNGTIEGNERGIYVRKTTTNNVEVATLQTAVTARNWMDNDIFTYNGVNYTYEICDQDRTTPVGSGCPIVIQPWKAYWIRVHGGGGATFELLIPN